MHISQHYREAGRRLFLLDYDGTLVDLAPTADDAKPTPEARNMLRGIAADPANTVVIVSGRDRHTLETWLGDLPVSLVAEHGLFVRELGSSWHSTRIIDQSWKVTIRQLMSSVDVPKSFIEDKTMALAWHYRLADPGSAESAARQLRRDLADPARHHHLKVMSGSKVVEVLPADVNKGRAVAYWLAKGEYDFIFAAGDDTTDEDLFRALPPKSLRFSVGGRSEHASHALATPAALIDYISILIKSATNPLKR